MDTKFLKLVSVIVKLCLVLGMIIGITGYQDIAYGAEKTVNFGYIVGSWPLDPVGLLLKEKKFLESEGLKVKWGEYMAGAYIMQHMIAGEVDFATVGVSPVMISKSRGADITILSGGSTTEGSVLVVANQIKTFADLDGKKVGTPGIGSIQDGMLSMFERKHNIKVQHKNMKGSDMPLFLQRGEIDGYIVWEPLPSLAVEQGHGHILATSRDILPGQRCCMFVTQGELSRKDPELVSKVFSAFMKAFDYYKKNPDEVLELLSKSTGMSKKVISLALKNVQVSYPPQLDIPGLKIQVEELIKDGKIQLSEIGNVDKFIEKSYSPAYLNEYLRREKKGR